MADNHFSNTQPVKSTSYVDCSCTTLKDTKCISADCQSALRSRRFRSYICRCRERRWLWNNP